jgi:hypothetical protein
MSMASGLHNSTETIASSFDQGPRLIYTDDDLSGSFIGKEVVSSLKSGFIAFTFSTVNISEGVGRTELNDAYAVSIFDPEDALGLNMTNESTSVSVLLGKDLSKSLQDLSINTVKDSTLLLSRGNQSTTVQLTDLYTSGSIFPDDWLMVPRSTMNYLRPDLGQNFSFLLLFDISDESDLPLGIDWADVHPSAGVVRFFENGIYQVEDDLWAIVLATGTIVVLLVYSIMSIETQYNAPTIETLRRLGAKRRAVVQIFMFKALIIALIGGVLGVAFGFCIANAVASGSYLFGITTMIVPMADLSTILIPISVSFVAGLIGGLIPSLRASKMFASRRIEL